MKRTCDNESTNVSVLLLPQAPPMFFSTPLPAVEFMGGLDAIDANTGNTHKYTHTRYFKEQSPCDLFFF